ncbi:MAG: hypothetical protein KY432_04395, partial [Acidobacteria bacterium]|nr:hypothetical protein [Acidobacteriota bacterium]
IRDERREVRGELLFFLVSRLLPLDPRLPHVVQHADVRVIQLRDRLRLALETELQLSVSRKFSRKDLTATERSRRVSRARYTSPIPPALIGDRTSYGPRRDPLLIAMLAVQRLSHNPGSRSNGSPSLGRGTQERYPRQTRDAASDAIGMWGY